LGAFSENQIKARRSGREFPERKDLLDLRCNPPETIKIFSFLSYHFEKSFARQRGVEENI
jgi:hypothetical protein